MRGAHKEAYVGDTWALCGDAESDDVVAIFRDKQK
jgi:hypothetical protein